MLPCSGGQDRIRQLWRHYFQNSAAVIFVIDSSDIARMNEAGHEMHRLLEEDGLKDAILLIFANKQDLPNAMSPSELKKKLRLNDLHDRKVRKYCLEEYRSISNILMPYLQWFIQPAYACQGIGIYEGLDWLSIQLMR